MLQLINKEAEVLTSQFAISKKGRDGRRTLPYALTGQRITDVFRAIQKLIDPSPGKPQRAIGFQAAKKQHPTCSASLPRLLRFAQLGIDGSTGVPGVVCRATWSSQYGP